MFHAQKFGGATSATGAIGGGVVGGGVGGRAAKPDNKKFVEKFIF